MGVFNKLAFWKKKEDDFGLNELDKSLNMPTGVPSPGSSANNLGLNTQPFSQPQQNQFQSQQYEFGQQQPQFQAFQQDQGYTIQKEIEVVSIKLDAIKAAIENISQRLANLERFAYNSTEQAAMPRQYYREFPPRSY